MKKTFSLSIAGRIFQVEEDAYALLLNYLQSLAQVFPGQDGHEIVDDIEARISDIFQEQVDNGKIVFTLSDAEAVIATIGDADQLAETSDELEAYSSPQANTQENTERNEHRTATPTYSNIPEQTKRKLFRSDTNSVLGGVLDGLAIRFGVNVLPLRIITVLLIFPLGFFPIFIAYCIAWAIIPPANTPERKLEQMGKPVTVANIGEVLSRQKTSAEQSQNTGSTFLRVLGALCMGFCGLIAAFVGICIIIAIAIMLGFTCAAIFGATIPQDAFFFGEYCQFISTWGIALGFLATICICIAILIPCVALVWAACSVLFKVKGASKAVWLTALIIESLAIIIPSVVIPFIPQLTTI